MSEIVRDSRVASYALTNSLSTTQAIDASQAASGAIHIPDGSSITSLAFYAATALDGTFAQCYDSTNTAITMTVAQNRAYQLPDSLYPFSFLKIVIDQASVSVPVVLKT